MPKRYEIRRRGLILTVFNLRKAIKWNNTRSMRITKAIILCAL
jgi:hypothetical protein